LPTTILRIEERCKRRTISLAHFKGEDRTYTDRAALSNRVNYPVFKGPATL